MNDSKECTLLILGRAAIDRAMESVDERRSAGRAMQALGLTRFKATSKSVLSYCLHILCFGGTVCGCFYGER